MIDAFSVPKLRYNVDRKAFFKADTPEVLHGDAELRALMFRDRYQLIHQRMLSHPLFTPPAFGENKEYFKLSAIESLLGMSEEDGMICMFGMLTQLKEGRWFLEDLNSNVELDLANADATTGLFVDGYVRVCSDIVLFVGAAGWVLPCLMSQWSCLCRRTFSAPSRARATDIVGSSLLPPLLPLPPRGPLCRCFVVVQGVYTGSIFKVAILGQPPPEPRNISIAQLAGLNFFGGHIAELMQNYDEIKRIEEAAADEMIVLLSDVFLDRSDVMNMLRNLFTGYSDRYPTRSPFLPHRLSDRPPAPRRVRAL